jgi:glycosidase
MTRLILLVALLLPLPAAAQPARTPPEWSRQAVIYQLNTRQFTAEGTLAAARQQLPRIQALGADIVWLMPIHPIGEKNRKGTLGSPYSVRDYRAVNPELGTMEDLKRFVATAHSLGLKVVLDWVANHSAWDNALVTQHPDWYVRDWQGNFRPTPWWDWSDIIDFDYRQPALRRYMADSMAHWVREADIDGFRADVACFVPSDFWAATRAELDRLKPGLWLLAECETRDIHQSFDASYHWAFGDTLHAIGQGRANVDGLRGQFATHDKTWPRQAQRMLFTSNHDKNSWEGTAAERFGPALTNAIVLSFVADGIPLIYGGQEAGEPRRLQFFERDPIEWRDHPNADLFRRLIAFRDATPALHNAPWGGPMVEVATSDRPHLLAFLREAGSSRVLALFNFSAQPRTLTFADAHAAGRWKDWNGDGTLAVAAGQSITLPPWSNRVLIPA